MQPPVSGEIPFEFHAGANVLPAGKYFADAGIVPGRGPLRSADQNAAVFVLTNVAHRSQAPAKGELLIHMCGDAYFLWQVWGSGHDQGRELRQSALEREMAQNATRSEIASVHLSQP